MRIVISSDIYPPVVSGVSTVVDKQSRSLASRGHTVVVIAPGYPPYTRIPVTKNLSHYTIWAVPNLLRENSYIGYVPPFHMYTMLSTFKPDVVHFHSIGPVGYATLKAAKQLNIPTIGTMHGIPQFITAYAPWLTKTSKRVTHKILWWFIRSFYNRMDHITTPSLFAAKQMSNHRVTTKITVLPMWIDQQLKDLATPSPRPVRTKIDTRYLFLYVGRIDIDKNLPVVLYAIQLLKNSSKNFHVIFAGKGSYLIKLKALAEALSISEYITWTGYIDEGKKIQLYARAHSFIMPSPVETQSLTTLEALQARLPLILANSGALPEIAEKFPLQSNLFIHTNPQDLANRMLSHIQNIPKKHTPKQFKTIYGKDDHIHKLEQLYKQIAS